MAYLDSFGAFDKDEDLTITLKNSGLKQFKHLNSKHRILAYRMSKDARNAPTVKVFLARGDADTVTLAYGAYDGDPRSWLMPPLLLPMPEGGFSGGDASNAALQRSLRRALGSLRSRDKFIAFLMVKHPRLGGIPASFGWSNAYILI